MLLYLKSSNNIDSSDIYSTYILIASIAKCVCTYVYNWYNYVSTYVYIIYIYIYVLYVLEVRLSLVYIYNIYSIISIIVCHTISPVIRSFFFPLLECAQCAYVALVAALS